MKSLKASVLGAVATLALTGLADGPFDPDQWRSFENDGRALPPKLLKLYEARESAGVHYRLMKPIGYTPKKSYPIILSLHGRQGAGSENLRNLRKWNVRLADRELRQKYPCFVLVPQTLENWTDPLAQVPEITPEYIRQSGEGWRPILERHARRKARGLPPRSGGVIQALELLDTIVSEFPIDPSRIYVIGHSMGAIGSWNALHRRPDLFAAAISSAGGSAPWYEMKRIAHVPLWAFHGELDPNVSVTLSREAFAAMSRNGGSMKYTELKGVLHDSASVAFDYQGDDEALGNLTQCSGARCDPTSNIWEWLFRQTKPPTAKRLRELGLPR